MKFKIDDHLQEIGTIYHGVVTDTDNFLLQNNETWYLLQNDEIGLINHWVPENKLELHKQDIRQNKLNQLGIQ